MLYAGYCLVPVEVGASQTVTFGHVVPLNLNDLMSNRYYNLYIIQDLAQCDNLL